MKKAIKPILITLVVLCVVAFVVCNFVMPTETKAFLENVIVLAKQPLPIIGISIITFGGVVLTFLSRTSWGKKALKKLEDKVNGLVAKAKAYEEEAKSCVEKAEKNAEETKLILAEYKSELDTFAEQLAVACETSPNAKIREYAKTIRTKKEEIDTLYAEKKNNLAKSVDERINEQNRLEKCEQEIMGLRGILEELKGLGVQNESEE
jgi:Skp family chaperone for outer membrane proteins